MFNILYKLYNTRLGYLVFKKMFITNKPQTPHTKVQNPIHKIEHEGINIHILTIFRN